MRSLGLLLLCGLCICTAVQLFQTLPTAFNSSFAFTTDSPVVDTTPPQLLACGVHGDVTNSTESIWTANCTDESGVYLVTFYFISPSGRQYWFNSAVLTLGMLTDGYFETSSGLGMDSRDHEIGTYRLFKIIVTDLAGNQANFSAQSCADLGDTELSFTYTGITADTIAPSCTDLRFKETVVDSPWFLDVTAQCTDMPSGGGASGIDSLTIFYSGPAGTSFRMTDVLQPSDTPGLFESTTNLAAYFSEPQSGIYIVTKLVVKDLVGNTRVYLRDEISSRGWSHQLELIEGRIDSIPPSCNMAGFQLTTLSFDVDDFVLLTTGDCVDNEGGSGVATLQSFYFLQSDQFPGGDQVTDFTPPGYMILQLNARLDFDPYTPSSTYKIIGVLVYDNSANSILYGTCGPFATAFAGTAVTGGCQVWAPDSSSGWSGGQVAGLVIGLLILIGLMVVSGLFIYDKFFRDVDGPVRVIVPGLPPNSREPFPELSESTGGEDLQMTG